MPSRTRPVHTRETYIPTRESVKRCHVSQHLAATIFAAAFVLVAVAAIVLGGILADLIPTWYWPILGLAIGCVGICLLARGDS